MNALSEGFVLGYLFCAVTSGALLIVAVRWGGDAGEDPEEDARSQD